MFSTHFIDFTNCIGELKTLLRPTPPDPGSVPTTDLFSGLGPLGVFSARNR